MRKRLVVLAAISLAASAGCRSTPETPTAAQTHLPDGSLGHSIRCSGDMSGCHEKAGELCKGQGYAVVTQQQSKTTSIGFTGARSQNIYDVLIACKR